MATRNPPSRILYCSSGLIHPTFWARKNLRSVLHQFGNCEIVDVNRINFETLITDYKPHLIVLYFHLKTITKASLNALQLFVEDGGSILAVHSASASFKQNTDYHNLLGGKFSHHGPIQDYEIRQPNKTISGISQPIPSHIIKDELYLHEFSNDINIVLETSIGDQTEPVAWVKSSGKGKVMYYAPGHRSAIFKTPEVVISIHNLMKIGLGR